MVILFGNILTNGGTQEIVIPVSSSLMKVEIPNGSLTIKGRFEKDGDLYVLGAIKASDFSKVLTIDSSGIYSIEVSGIYSVQLIYTGSASVKYKLIG